MTTGPRASLADRVFEGLTGRTVMEEHFPMLLDAGIPDIGLTVHSHFLTFLAGVGQSMGFAAVAECPIWWARERGLGDVRADSAWFDKPDMNARLAFEFEHHHVFFREFAVGASRESALVGAVEFVADDG